MQTLRDLRHLPRNVWAVSLTSFLTDISSEMVINLVPLFLANVLGVRTGVIGLIEGVAEATASLLKLVSGQLSDRIGGRKWLAVLGYGLSAASKPFYYGATTWGTIAGVRWADRVGKGIRTAPRDALLADSVDPAVRGLGFGFQRTADTAGAFLGLAIAWFVVWRAQASTLALDRSTFQTLVLLSLLPAFLAVVVLAAGARDVPRAPARAQTLTLTRGLGRPFLLFLVIAGLFDLGNSSDAFLVLRAQERGAGVLDVLGMLLDFNAVYTLVSTPAGQFSDRVGRGRVLAGGWLLYALVYLGFAFAPGAGAIWGLYALYGLYYGMSYGTAKALIADLVPAEQRGSAYGAYNALLGVLDLPASLIAGLLWQGWGRWTGLGPSAPFLFGAALALLATAALLLWRKILMPPVPAH